MKKSNCKPNRIWENKGNEFYKRSIKRRIQKENAEIYSTYNEGK